MYRVKIVKVERVQTPDKERRQPWVLGAGKTPEEYGYAPFASAAEMQTVETEVLSQTVDALDLAAVIKAVNGL